MKHRFRTGIYTISRIFLYGMCSGKEQETSGDDREIWINPSIRGCVELDTIIHESLHAEFPKLSEKEVAESATTIAKLLWKMGYRNERRAKSRKVSERSKTHSEGPERAGPQASPSSDHRSPPAAGAV